LVLDSAGPVFDAHAYDRSTAFGDRICNADFETVLIVLVIQQWAIAPFWGQRNQAFTPITDSGQ
jgi:hypothetical protein